MKRLKELFFLVFALVFFSCEKDYCYDVVFLGDTQVKNWNLDESFPNLSCYNFGEFYTGFDLLKASKGRFSNHEIVILTGTHDFKTSVAQSNEEEYVNNYINYILGLGRNNEIYLFSILPFHYEGDLNTEIERNLAIKTVNMKLKARAESLGWTYINVYDDFIEGDHFNTSLTTDGQHLNALGYSILSSKLKSVLHE